MTGTSRTAQGPLKSSAREAALTVLTRVEQDHSYSNLLLNQTLRSAHFERQDAALATELVYGTLQHLSTIDYFLGRFIAKGVASLQPWVRNLLRLSFYQLYYLDKIPPHAAVHEAVNIAKRKGHQGVSGMVNGVLRNVIRQKEALIIPSDLPAVQRIALKHAHPEWMVERWVRKFGEAIAEQICEANNTPPHSSIRVNTQKTSREELLSRWREAGYEAEPSAIAPAGIRVAGGGNLALTDEFRSGLFTVQDESSMLVAEVVDPQPGMRVLDCCAAPGGKSTHLAEKMKDEGFLAACDIHEHKEKLIRDQTQRLGLHAVHPTIADALQLQNVFERATFDRILLDAPCSGLGVIRRKPDLKWTKTEAEIATISDLQRKMIEAVYPLLKPGGILVYSTCTITQEENDDVVDSFLQAHPEFVRDSFPVALSNSLGGKGHDGQAFLLPSDFGSDGFFIARLRKTQ